MTTTFSGNLDIIKTNQIVEKINKYILDHIKTIEMVGVIVRIISFSIVSWFGSKSPYMFVWIVNSMDAIVLCWCAILRKNVAYSVLNIFWILVGIMGIARSTGII